jgi:DNA-binding MarR family transcriptional regulator
VNNLGSALVESGSEAENPAEAAITLGMLNAVAGNAVVTQRSLARELGIALGLANAYLKRCVGKGYIKVSHVPARRYTYYLTPKGFAEKSRLTAEYLSQSFNFFRLARGQCHELFAECARRGWSRVALVGAGDLAEIAKLVAESHEVELVGLVDRRTSRFGRLPVRSELAALGEVDAAIVTDLREPQATFERVGALLPGERVLAPALLHIVRQRPASDRSV